MHPSLCNFVAILAFALLFAGLPELANAQGCAGDCNSDDAVTIDELVIGRRIAREEVQLSECEAADVDENGTVETSELEAAADDASGPCAPPPATPMPFDPALPSINAGLISSNPGRIVQVDVSLFPANENIAATQNYLTFESPLSVLVGEGSQPACQLAEKLAGAIGAFAFAPDGCVPGDDCDRIIAYVDASDNTQQIQAESLYRCQVGIEADATPGLYPIRVLAPLVTDGTGAPFLATAFDGGVSVRLPATATPTSTATSTATETPTATPTQTPEATSTSTISIETPTEAPTPTPTTAPCAGDCDGDSTVDVSELVQGIGIALGTLPADACPAMSNGSGIEVTIDELVLAVRNALEGCVSASP